MTFTSADLRALSADRPAIRRAMEADRAIEAGRPTRAKPTNGMNKLEQAYARHLDLLKAAGEVTWWAFNDVRLRIASGEKAAWFRPDFAVLFSDACIGLEFHETKGFWREAARLRIKVAAGLYPIPFVAVTRIKGQWEYETFGGAGPR